MRLMQKARERAMRPRLRHAMQVETYFALLPALRQLRPFPAAERRERRHDRFFWRRSGDWDRQFRMSHGLGGNRRFRLLGNRRRIGGAVLLSQRLGLPGNALPQRALFLAQGSLAARRGPDFGGGVSW